MIQLFKNFESSIVYNGNEDDIRNMTRKLGLLKIALIEKYRTCEFEQIENDCDTLQEMMYELLTCIQFEHRTALFWVSEIQKYIFK
jgi:hypothetical protein